jgi:Tol biopolymer transport system component
MYGNVPKVYVVDMAGTPTRDPLHAARQPDFSPDGTRLIVNGDDGDLKRLRIEDLRDRSWTEIGDDRLIAHTHPFWSPDGTQIVYADKTLGSGPRMFIRDLDSNWPGSGPGSQLEAGLGTKQIVGRHPLWASQDRFIFQGCDYWTPKESECGLWSMQGNNGSPERLTDELRHIPTDVHEDVLVYVSDEAGDWNVYRLNIASGGTRRLTEDEAQDGLATISPDGRWVAFLSERGGRLAAWYVDIDGGTPKWLFDINISDWGGLRTDGWSEERMSWGSGP